MIDWSQCPAVESAPGRVSGAWVFSDTRMPISVIFETFEYGSSIEEIIENYSVTREQIQAVLQFAAWSATSTATTPSKCNRSIDYRGVVLVLVRRWRVKTSSGEFQHSQNLFTCHVEPLHNLVYRRTRLEVFKHNRNRHSRIAK